MINKITILNILIILLIGCQSREKQEATKDEQKTVLDTSTVIVKYDHTLFTLPSPYQATSYIKASDLGFNKVLLNPAENAPNYTTNFNKALNIGIYGTDLGYLNVYNQTPEVITYFSTIKDLSEDLGIDNALKEELIHRIENNIDNEDSLLYFLSNTYRKFDSYLNDNNRKEIGALIIAGGWIESLYILSQHAVSSENRNIINRLGEQKHPLDNLIEILSPYYYKSDEYTEMIDGLVDLAYEYDGIIYNYSYAEPELLEKEKTTIIHSKSNVIISEYHLRTIANKVSSIRNNIIH